MPTVNTIACAIDFSEASHVAMEMAADLTRRHGARLALVHVCEPPLGPMADFAYTPADTLQSGAAVRDAERMLASWRGDAERVTGRSVGGAVVVGDPATEIVRWSRDHRADLLVVGTHGRKGIRRLVLGSVAERVARDAECTVVVVRRDAGGDAD
jgi:nucleotide-binding universal stress UspA family protein